MTTFLFELLGAGNTKQIIIVFTYFIEQLICLPFFVWRYKRRNHFLLRAIVVIVVGCAYAAGLGIFRNVAQNSSFAPRILLLILNFTLQSLFAFLILFFCFDEKSSALVLCWCAVSAATQAVAKIYALILNSFGIDDSVSFSFFQEYNAVRDWTIHWLIHIALYVILGLIFGQRRKKEDPEVSRNVVILSVILVLLSNSLFSISRNFEAESFSLMVMTKIFSLIICIVTLILRTDFLAHAHTKQELQIVDELLRQERKQYETIKTNIDTVNIKCHDLKRELDRFEDKFTKNELESLKSALEIYDSNIKTGNEVLDAILYEKQLYCEKNKINLSCVADGHALSFLSTTHLYSLFGNVVTNAIEAVNKLDDPEKRIISIEVERKKDAVVICVTNYFDGDLIIDNGTLSTSKSDKNHHGYGLKSIQYIVNQYNGSLQVQAEDDIFYLTIQFSDIERLNSSSKKTQL